MRRLLGALLLALVAFCAGVFAAVWRGWGSPLISIEIINRSPEPLRSVAVLYETCGLRGSVVTGELLSGLSRKVKYSACGESGYHIEATTQAGLAIRGAEAYAESGYSLSATVTSSGIELGPIKYY